MMNDTRRELKKEVILHLENFKKNGLVKGETKAAYYVNGIILPLRKSNTETLKLFVSKLVSLLKKRNFPLLHVTVIHKLFERFKFYPQLFNELHFAHENAGDKELPNFVWEQIIFHSGKYTFLNRDGKKVILIYLWFVNRLTSSGTSVDSNLSFLNSLIGFNVGDKSIIELKTDLKSEDENPYYFIADRLELMINRGASLHQKSDFLLISVGIFTTKGLYFKDAIDLINLLDKILPNDYLKNLGRNNFLSILAIYKRRPQLVIDVPVMKSEPVHFEKIMSHIFSNFYSSKILLDRYVQKKLNERETNWLYHILEGNNLITAPELPFTLTKRMAHNFQFITENKHLKSVKDYLIYNAFLVNTKNKKYSLALTLLIKDFDNIDYWIQTLSLLFHKGLKHAGAQEVIDYLNQKVFREQRQIDLRRKTLTNLRYDIQDWHNELAERRMGKSYVNKKLPISTMPEIEIEHMGETYRIIQLKESRELHLEGVLLRHCVGTYTQQCISGECFIFSLSSINHQGSKIQKIPLITIQVKSNEIVQARGKYNRLPSKTEKEVIMIWAQQNNLRKGFSM